MLFCCFFLDMTDTEIAKHMNLVRSTIYHHRVSSLQALKRLWRELGREKSSKCSKLLPYHICGIIFHQEQVRKVIDE